MRDKTVLECNMSISEFEKFSGFFHCHRSYIVNLEQVRSITKNAVILETGEEVPLSRRLYNDVNKRFIEFYTKSE